MDGGTEREQPKGRLLIHLPFTRTTAVWATDPAAFSARQVYAPLWARSRSAMASIEVKSSICTGFMVGGNGEEEGEGEGEVSELGSVWRGDLLQDISIGLLPLNTEQVRESLSPRWRASGTVKGWILGDTRESGTMHIRRECNYRVLGEQVALPSNNARREATISPNINDFV